MLQVSAPTRLSSPPVIAAAMANTPASIRSGITVCSTAVSSLTPSTVMKPVPPPLMSRAHLGQERDDVEHLGLERACCR